MNNSQNTIKVMLADDSETLLSQLSSELGAFSDTKVIACASCESEIFTALSTERPDVIILDLVMPETDGFFILEKLSSMGMNVPHVIVMSAVGEETLIKRALGLGAEYYMVKPINAALLHKRILDIYDLRQQIFPEQTSAVKTKSIDEKITSIFLAIGIPAHIKGYQFLREAIKMVVNTPDTINYITKELYPGIARHFETSPSKVERAIRHAIEVAWTRGKVENMNNIFGYNIYSKLEKPTNGEFIALVADKLIVEKGA